METEQTKITQTTTTNTATMVKHLKQLNEIKDYYFKYLDSMKLDDPGIHGCVIEIESELNSTSQQISNILGNEFLSEIYYQQPILKEEVPTNKNS